MATMDETIPMMDSSRDEVSPLVGTRTVSSKVNKYGPWAVHILSATALILIVAWFSEVPNSYSFEAGKEFGWHPTLMTVGLLICFSESAIVYRSFTSVDRTTRKGFHGVLHGIALICAVLGLYAAFSNHNARNIKNMYSLHSWLGLITVILFFAQYVLGFLAFAYPKFSIQQRSMLVPIHSRAGLLILACLVSATVCMGVLEKLFFSHECDHKNPDTGETESTKICYIGNSFALVAVALTASVSMILLSPKPVGA